MSYLPAKKSASFYARHTQDVYTSLGYDYRGRIFEKTLSKGILANKNNKSIMDKIDTMFVNLIDNVKQIKAYFMISVDKNDRNLN